MKKIHTPGTPPGEGGGSKLNKNVQKYTGLFRNLGGGASLARAVLYMGKIF